MEIQKQNKMKILWLLSKLELIELDLLSFSLKRLSKEMILLCLGSTQPIQDLISNLTFLRRGMILSMWQNWMSWWWTHLILTKRSRNTIERKSKESQLLKESKQTKEKEWRDWECSLINDYDINIVQSFIISIRRKKYEF